MWIGGVVSILEQAPYITIIFELLALEMMGEASVETVSGTIEGPPGLIYLSLYLP